MMRLGGLASGGIHPLVVALLVGTALSGCFGMGDSDSTSEESDDAIQNPWELGLNDWVTTPAMAMSQSDDARRENVSPPGSPEFAGFDAAIMAYMEDQEIPTAQLAIMKDGQVRYEQAFGYVNHDGTEQADTDTMFRIASTTKPMTATIVWMQVEQGFYSWEDPVFCVPPDPDPACLLPIDPHPNHPVVDESLGDIQVHHLLDHRGGWGRSTDPLIFGDGPPMVAEALGVDSPPPAWRNAQYLMGQPLQDAPGERFEYCNLCYDIAGLVAEAATEASLRALYDAYLFRPLDLVGEIEPGKTLLEDRNPREPFYTCQFDDVVNVYSPNETVCFPDGGISLDSILASGGLIATSSAIATVYESYTEHVPHRGYMRGIATESMPFEYQRHGGKLPGTDSISIVIQDEPGLAGKVQVVVLLNKGIWCTVISQAGQSIVECPKESLEERLFALAMAWGAADGL